MTRLSVTEVVEGWLKRTFSPLAIEKLIQSMIALLVDWLMTWLVGVGWVIVAWPATTVPPCGAAGAAPEKPRQIAKLSGWKAKERRRRSAVRTILVGRFFIRR